MANKKEDITKDKDVKKILNEIDSQINSKKEAMLKEFTEKMDEQIEIGVQKKFDQLEKKIVKGKNGKIFRRDIAIIVLLAISIYFAYLLYNMGYFNKDMNISLPSISQNEEIDAEEEVRDASYYIENYSYLVAALQIPNNVATYQNGIKKENFTNDMKLKIAYKNLSEDMQAKSDTLITFSADNLLEVYKNVIGENETIEYANFDYENLKFLYYDNTFISGIEQATEEVPSTISNYTIVNAYENANGLNFEVKYDGLDQVCKFVFELKDSTYYFTSVEK